MIWRWQRAPPALPVVNQALWAWWWLWLAMESQYKLLEAGCPVSSSQWGFSKCCMQAPGPPPPLRQVLTLMVSLPPSWVPQQLLWSSMGLSLYLNLHIEKSDTTVRTQIFDSDDIVHYVLATHLEPCPCMGMSVWAASRSTRGQEVAPRGGGIRTTLSALWTDQAQMWQHLSKCGLYHRPGAISTAAPVDGQGSSISHRKTTIPLQH